MSLHQPVDGTHVGREADAAELVVEDVVVVERRRRAIGDLDAGRAACSKLDV